MPVRPPASDEDADQGRVLAARLWRLRRSLCALWAFRLGRTVPPRRCRRTTALTATTSQLLIELKSKPNASGATSAKLDHELAVEIRGPKHARAELWAVALQARTHEHMRTTRCISTC